MLSNRRSILLTSAAATAAVLLLSGCARGEGDSEPDESMQAPATSLADALTENEIGGTLDFGALLPSGATGAVIACSGDTPESLAESTGLDVGSFQLPEGTLPVPEGAFALLFGDAEDRITTSASYETNTVDLCSGAAVASTYLGAGAHVMLTQLDGVWVPTGVE